MKFTAFNGSPSAENSATNRIISAFLKGAKQAGAQTEVYHLMHYDIKQCRGCFSCWFQTPGKCAIGDQMEELLKAYISADVVLFGSPVFSWNMTGLLKNFADRLVPLKSPMITQNDGDFDMKNASKREQKCIAVSNCGFPGDNNFEIIKAAFSCCNPVLEIYRNCGKLLTSKQEIAKNIIKPYLAAVERAGAEMAATGDVCSETKQKLQKPLMSVEEYVKFLGM